MLSPHEQARYGNLCPSSIRSKQATQGHDQGEQGNDFSHRVQHAKNKGPQQVPATGPAAPG